MRINESQGGVGRHVQDHSEAHAGGHTIGDLPDQVNPNPHSILEQKQENNAEPAAGYGTDDAYHGGGHANETTAMPIPDNANDGNQSAESPAGLDDTLKSADKDTGPAWPGHMSNNETAVRQDPVIRSSSPADRSAQFAIILNREPDHKREEELQSIFQRLGNGQADSEPLLLYGRSLSLSSDEGPLTPAHKRPRSK